VVISNYLLIFSSLIIAFPILTLTNSKSTRKLKGFIWMLCLVSFMFCNHLFAQSNRAESEEQIEEVGEMVFSLSPSYTWIPAGANLEDLDRSGKFAPGLGVDFFYRIHPKWEIGTMMDIEFAKYLIPRKDDLKRERAFIVTAIAAYKINSNWNLFAGAGIELEQNKNLAVVRIGGEYMIHLKNKWFIPIGAFADLKPGYDSWSLMFGVGKKFR